MVLSEVTIRFFRNSPISKSTPSTRNCAILRMTLWPRGEETLGDWFREYTLVCAWGSRYYAFMAKIANAP